MHTFNMRTVRDTKYLMQQREKLFGASMNRRHRKAAKPSDFNENGSFRKSSRTSGVIIQDQVLNYTRNTYFDAQQNHWRTQIHETKRKRSIWRGKS